MKCKNFFGIVVLLLPLLSCTVEMEPDRLAASSSSGGNQPPLENADPDGLTPDSVLNQYFLDRISDRQVRIQAPASRLLADDNEGCRHQRFIVRLKSGQTLLIAHNIDLAPYIPLALGDQVQIYGEYEWNSQGGVVHWTHKDPAGRHLDGWILHNGTLYQ